MQTVGSYIVNLTELIGQGSYAVVYKGHHSRKSPKEVVAVKKIVKKRLSLFPHALQKEICILRELTTVRHRNIVSLFDCEETPEYVYVFLEYCNGGDMQQYIRGFAPLQEDLVAFFLRQLASSLMVLHTKGIVHRDLKPQNILICYDEQHKDDPFRFLLKIADFGFARFLGDGVMTETQCGSPIYMAPEIHLSNKYDGKADLFSVGVVAYQCLTSKHPFYAPTREQLADFYRNNQNAKPRYPADLSPGLKDLLEGLLATNPDQRMNHKMFFQHKYLIEGSDEVAMKRRRQDSIPSFGQDLTPSPADVSHPRPFPPAKTFPVIKKPKESSLHAINQQRTPRLIEKPCRPVSPLLDGYVVISKGDVSDDGDDADKVSAPMNASPSRPLTSTEKSPSTTSAPISIPLRARMFQHLYQGDLQKTSSSPDISGSQLRSSPKDSSPSSSPHSSKVSPVSVFPRQSSLAKMPSVESLSAPPVQFVVGTPNSDSSNSPTVLTPVSSVSPFNRQGSQLNLPLHMRYGSSNNSLQRFSDSGSSVDSPSSPPRSFFFPDIQSSFSLSPPVLTEKALLDKSDLQVINKFEFILELSRCIQRLAHARDSSLSESLVLGRELPRHGSMETNEKQRRVEQIQLYVYALNLLSSAITLAHDLINNGKVKSSQTLKQVVTKVNDCYTCCLAECNSIKRNYASVLCSTSIPNPSSKTLQGTEQLLYSCATDLCRSAWADQLCGNLQGCCQSYNSAHLLLHILGKQLTHEDDRMLLEHYRDAVEKEMLRLSALGFAAVKED